ncbi:uncharacterized protein LOC144764037 [Lissotriton helveticus]
MPKGINRPSRMTALLQQPDNIWTYLAGNVLNASHFCMSNLQSTADMISTCLVAVPTPAQVLLHIFNQTNFDGVVEESDVQTHLILYEYCRFCPEVTDSLWRNMTSIGTYNISTGDVCYQLTCDPTKIGKCGQLKLEKSKQLTPDQQTLCQSRHDSFCSNVTKYMVCNHTVLAASHVNHVKLPKGWLFLCGNISYTYIPANITGGPCALSQLSLMLFPIHSVTHIRSSRAAIQLPEDCNSDIDLLSRTEYTSLALSIVGVPGLSVYNARTIAKLACLIVKNLNHTSAALAELLLDVQGTRKAVLQNRADVDYLLLKHNHGCEDFDGLCCFNLSDHSTSIHVHINALKDLVKGVTQDVDQGWWDWLFGWLPNFGQLRYILGVIIVIICVFISLCCCIQCIPNLFSLFCPRSMVFRPMGYDG